MRIILAVTAIFALPLLNAITVAQTITATQTDPMGIYAAGEKVTWTLNATGENVATLTAVPYAVKQNMLTTLSEGQIDLSKGSAELSATIGEPGAINVSMKIKPTDKVSTWVAGAIFEPEKLKPSVPTPNDFDAFWKEKIATAEAVALNPTVDAMAVEQANIELFRVQLDNVNGTKVHGQLAKPAKPGKFPAVVIFQSAGVGPLPRYNVLPRAMQGFIAFNIIAHDLPIDESPEFYKQLNATTLKNYTQIGNDDREKSYFLRMYLACYQAVRYMTTRDDWDGKTIVVMGTSQGGMQALVTGGLHPAVTHVLANVPAGCDAAGPLHGRATGFPYWRGWGREPNKVTIEVGRYFDVANFTPRIKVPTLVATGLIDEACPATGVTAAVNAIPGEKELIIMPTANHYGLPEKKPHDYYPRSEQWLGAIVKGQAVPVKQ